MSPGYGTSAGAAKGKTGSSSTGPWNLTAQAAAGTSAPSGSGDTGSASGGAGTVVSGDPGQAAYIIGSAQRGADLFSQQCTGCHGQAGKDPLSNPGSKSGTVPVLNPIDRDLFSRSPSEFAANIDLVIQHGSVPEGTPAIAMPAFGDDGTLNQQQIAGLIAYVMDLNGVDRAMITNPGIHPVRFYFMTMSVLLIVGLALAGAWSRKTGPRLEQPRETRGS
jgi:mono/diheme cytochrome c family protein